MFEKSIFPALTPLAIGLGRPFPYISNLSLSLAVTLRDPDQGTEVLARVKVPKELLGRFVKIGDGGATLVPLEDLIAANLGSLFPGMEVTDHSFFRVTRDTDYDVSDEADDLLQAVEEELRRRRFGEVVRLEVDQAMSPKLREQLRDALSIDERQLYETEGLLDLSDLWDVVGVRGFSELRDPPHTPVTQPRLLGEDGAEADVFGAIREADILVHHPYDSFTSSVERFVKQAVDDPDVLAIKQTVYRTSADSPLVPSLIEAAERGKQAVCMVELKARFDERANIRWAKKLEEAGVHVVYGLPALKTHAKCILIVRREGDGRPPLRAHRHRQLQPEDGAPVHRLRPVHGRSRDRRRPRRDVQLPDRLLTAARLPQGPGRALQPPGRNPRARSSARSSRTRPSGRLGSG